MKFLTICSVIALTFTASSTLEVQPLVDYAARQYTKLATTIPETGAFISTGDPRSLIWRTTDRFAWTAGFYAGSLWMLYKHTNDPNWRRLAEANQVGLFSNQFNREDHDIGFVIMSSYGLALEYTGPNQAYENIIVQAATSLCGRFFRLAGVTRSWNSNAAQREVLVIVDNMMNLELLFKAYELSGEEYFFKVAVSHADRTILDHVRPDGSTFHVVAYSEETGQVNRKYTAQGYADDSTWSRGQAWAIYGFTTTYKKTGLIRYLNVAKRTADFFIAHLHPDFVPIWDFNSPYQTSYQPRDTAAGSIAACALLELHILSPNQEYLDVAVKILENLSDGYRADGNLEYFIPSILVNGTVFFNQGDFNTAITYGDYYFLKGLDLYKSIQG